MILQTPPAPAEVVNGQEADSLKNLIDEKLRAARISQKSWAATSIRERLTIVRRFRYRLVAGALEMAAAVPPKSPAGAVEKLAAEVVPVADACHFLERRARRLLAPKKFGGSGRPVWLFGVKAEGSTRAARRGADYRPG